MVTEKEVTERLRNLDLTEKSCSVLALALSSENTTLTELDLSYNTLLQDSGVKKLCEGLKSPHCKLEKLRLRSCSIKGRGSAALFSTLKSNPSCLTELDLSGNKLGDSGVKELPDLLKDPQCKLQILQLAVCRITDEGCAALIKALTSNPYHLKELNLSRNKPGDSAVKELSELLKDSQCKLEKLQLWSCSITEEGCDALIEALKSNPSSHLRELNLSGNKPGDSGVKKLSDLLKDPDCKLEKLELRHCGLTEKSCAVLASALRSKNTSLRELDLSENKVQDSGVKKLCKGLKNKYCKLEILRLEYCSITDKGCVALFKALKANPSHLKELNLNNNDLGHSAVKKLSEVLKEESWRTSTPSTLAAEPSQRGNSCKAKAKATPREHHSSPIHVSNRLEYCSITDEGCAALFEALKSNPSHLRKLNLNHNELKNSAVKKLSELLKEESCKLEKLE
ncbi:ribonuclease inhibitor-like [Colossoma macropomum]|uniref:ribonuclease inhibitor-like n=1 Tax=Colossoma macropomum TaxID=42526 RepID=UPI00186536D9|nr:ribonuclease inhibitor-like [Colossoma macropomum]